MKGGRTHTRCQLQTTIIVLLHASCTSNTRTHNLLDWLGICSKVGCKPAIYYSIIIPVVVCRIHEKETTIFQTKQSRRSCAVNHDATACCFVGYSNYYYCCSLSSEKSTRRPTDGA